MIGEAEKARLRVGYKQTVRAFNESKAEKVFIAEDCADHIKDDLMRLADTNGTSVVSVPTMKELGNICSIEVGASCAVILK